MHSCADTLVGNGDDLVTKLNNVYFVTDEQAE
jgi:hypothetical protein